MLLSDLGRELNDYRRGINKNYRDIGYENEIKSKPIITRNTYMSIKDVWHGKQAERFSDKSLYIVGTFVDPICSGVYIPNFSGLYIPLSVVSSNFFIHKPMKNLNHVALAVTIKEEYEKEIELCFIQYGQTEWVLGYHRNEDFYFFNARVINPRPGGTAYNEDPDIIVKSIDNYKAFFVRPLPDHCQYYLNDQYKGRDKILCIYNKKENKMTPASL